MNPQLHGSSELQRVLAPLFLTGAGLLCLATGCSSWVGPVHLRIATGGARYDDFVIEPSLGYRRLHDSDVVVQPLLIVASEEDLNLPRIPKGGANFSTFTVSAYHPEFVYTWTAESRPRGGVITLPLMTPQSWDDHLKQHGPVSMAVANSHLDRIQLRYLPAFEAGAARRRLQRYLPGLADFVAAAEMQRGDSSYWPDEEQARNALEEKLTAISRLMR